MFSIWLSNHSAKIAVVAVSAESAKLSLATFTCYLARHFLTVFLYSAPTCVISVSNRHTSVPSVFHVCHCANVGVVAELISCTLFSAEVSRRAGNWTTSPEYELNVSGGA